MTSCIDFCQLSICIWGSESEIILNTCERQRTLFTDKLSLRLLCVLLGHNTAAMIRDDLDHVLHFATIITRWANYFVISNTSGAERVTDSWRIPTVIHCFQQQVEKLTELSNQIKLYFLTSQSLTSIQYLHPSYSRSMSVTKKWKMDKWKEKRTLGLSVKSLSYIARFLWVIKKKMYFAVCSFLYSVVAYFLMITCLVYLTGNAYAQTTFFSSY